MLIVEYKPEGQTPLEIVNKYKAKHPECEKVSYMGRLDPLAEGVILLLTNDKNKHRDKYMHMDKEYEFEVLLGIQTDSYDILGEIIDFEVKSIPGNYLDLVKSWVQAQIGKKQQPYPPYSSKPVMGHALFWWARQGRLNEIEIPKKEVEIYSLKVESVQLDSLDQLSQLATKRIAQLGGDFRQEKISQDWERLRKNNPGLSVVKLKFSVGCSSGTYVRQLVHELGEYLGCGAIAWSIKRTKFGEFGINNCLFID